MLLFACVRLPVILYLQAFGIFSMWKISQTSPPQFSFVAFLGLFGLTVLISGLSLGLFVGVGFHGSRILEVLL